MAVAQEFETQAVAPEQLQEARQFAASYAGEHVAGTEFVIGALFVAWGVGTYDILYGLLFVLSQPTDLPSLKKKD